MGSRLTRYRLAEWRYGVADPKKNPGLESLQVKLSTCARFFMRTSVSLRQHLVGIYSSRCTLSSVSSASRIAPRSNPASLRSFTSQQTQLPWRRRRPLTPWTITEEELKDEAKMVESVRRGIWEGLNGGMLDGFAPGFTPSSANQASRRTVDKRKRNEEQMDKKRRKLENGEDAPPPIYATQFSKEDIDNEERRPKKKVAVLLGYSGTGYKGMQLSETEKTIEGELFTAFVAAGAISKANATDPKKSSLVRCARTDKGVHAAGNMVSLKLIIEDPDIVQKINEHLSSQIRVWDILLTPRSFSAYQMCDSRIYEYLIPTNCFLPPHPSTYLGKKLPEIAEKEGDLEAWKARQEEVAGFWEKIDEEYIRPILNDASPEVRRLVEKALYLDQEKDESSQDNDEQTETQTETKTEDKPAETTTADAGSAPTEINPEDAAAKAELDETRRRVSATVKAIKAAYNKAKRTYRIPRTRLARVQAALDKYVGTINFWNFTIQKTFKDPSAKRHIKSFRADPNPIIINGTEWLSLKVHGQSFMMHQIRKMVAMATLVVRCGCDPRRIDESYGSTKIPIPKAPGLGLLLEHPVFDSYNRKGALDNGKPPVDFDKYADRINEFKQREIYDRIFREEEESNAFASFFNHVDHFGQEDFLYLTSGGIPAAARPSVPESTEGQETSDQTGRKSQREALAEVESECEDETNPAEGG
ncbi:tRNA pseudouridine synthase 1 [Aspergillus nanangensis]|uniref:tRNA pseudouridine synthase 1 n=1 Tax=Aspergillus nanangensis TaxID=2582783 RepID=A0AAD4GX40_ASPNN|nr:tRNA pseudouridine synthase 1 [Aspergillus nanangensis]